MKYRLIAVDLDGTLLNERGEVSDANRKALAAAREAGAIVAPCTGRSWREAQAALRGLPGMEMGIFITGAVVADMNSGESIDFAEFEPHVAHDIVNFMADSPEAVLVYREHNHVGHEYLVTGHGELTGNTRWWFEYTNALVHFQRHVSAKDLHHTLRIGMVASGPRVPEVCDGIAREFGDKVEVHHFQGFPDPEAQEPMYILEIFAAGVDKWRGVDYIASRHRIPREQIAVIGDEINDVSMVRQAGLGVAMGNAVQATSAVADRRTLCNDDDGVAHAIQQMLDGKW